mgnify:CR=1 FL=1
MEKARHSFPKPAVQRFMLRAERAVRKKAAVEEPHSDLAEMVYIETPERLAQLIRAAEARAQCASMTVRARVRQEEADTF